MEGHKRKARRVINWKFFFAASYFAIKFMSRRIMGTINQRLGNLIFLLPSHLRHNLTHHHELELQTSLTFRKWVINKLAFFCCCCCCGVSLEVHDFLLLLVNKEKRENHGNLLYKIKLILRGNYEGGHFSHFKPRTS